MSTYNDIRDKLAREAPTVEEGQLLAGMVESAIYHMAFFCSEQCPGHYWDNAPAGTNRSSCRQGEDACSPALCHDCWREALEQKAKEEVG